MCLLFLDIDECTKNPSLCGKNAVCNNTAGSYFCRCEDGFISSKKEMKKFNATHRVKCTDLNECLNETDLCGANAECNNTEGSYFCTCKEGFTPSNGNKTFKADQQVKCEGLVQYSGDPKTEWHLNSYTTKDEVINAVRNLSYKGGNTMTGRALTFIQQNSFRLESGSRENVSKIGILVTDGKSQDDIVFPAQSLRDAGVELFAIGVKHADETELKLIASKPDETHVYNVADFSFLNDILDGLTSNVCDGMKQQEEEIRRVKNADEELKVITSKPDETHVYSATDFSTINTITEGLTCNVCDAVKQQEEKIRPPEQLRIFCLKKDAEAP